MNAARNGDESEGHKGEQEITYDEIVMRRDLARVYRARRDDAKLTQAEVGRKIDPHYEKSNTWVSNFEKVKGNYSIWFGMQLAKAIDPAWSLGKALIEAGYETGSLDQVNTISAIEADTRLPLAIRRTLIAAVQRAYDDYEAERASAYHRAKIRDSKPDEPVTPASALEVLTEGWADEHREALRKEFLRIDRERQAPPVRPPRRRRPTNDNDKDDDDG